MDTSFIHLLACPKCKGQLTLIDNHTGLQCDACQIVYLIDDGIPLLLIESAVSLHQWNQQKSNNSQK